jgi:hypothetical protein
VLHSWGQNPHIHPHLHCVVPGGGLSADHDRWITALPGFFLPVRVLSRLFRRLSLEAFEKAYAAGQLQFFGELEPLREPPAYARYLAPLKNADWVVYAKPPLGGPQQALQYLGRYTNLLPCPTDCRDLLAALTAPNLRLCPQCGIGILVRIQLFPCYGPALLRLDTS